ncbi:hypothetical protein B0H11DRAFT_1905960 [Mycena galericulata]|nr:hypothetical protein B0H11DRAFT_1905960 [Mycena galericulata]
MTVFPCVLGVAPCLLLLRNIPAMPVAIQADPLDSVDRLWIQIHPASHLVSTPASESAQAVAVQCVRIDPLLDAVLLCFTPGVKKGDSIDVENWLEYETLPKDIIETRPPKMSIYIDMADIQKRWSARGSRGSDNEDEDADLYDSQERGGPRSGPPLRLIYTGTSYPLSPQMMKEWCRAMKVVKERPQSTSLPPLSHIGLFQPYILEIFHKQKVGMSQLGMGQWNNLKIFEKTP